MSLFDRAKALEESRVITLSNGWRIQARDLLPLDFVSGPCAGDVQGWLTQSRGDLLTLQAIQAGGEEGAQVAAAWAEEQAARRADPEILARAARLQAAALTSSIVAIAEPDSPLEPVRVVEDGEVLENPPTLPLRALAAMWGPSVYSEAADILLLRAVGGEAGQKAALAFRDVRRAGMAGSGGAGLRVPTVATAAGESGGSADRPDLLDAGGGGAGATGA